MVADATIAFATNFMEVKMPSFSRNINVISRCASAYRADRFEGYGISSAHYFYIIAICKNPGISQDKLAKKLYINKSSVARVLQVLETDGFITRAQSDTDRRITLVYPTKKSEELLPTVLTVSHDWESFLFEDIDEKEREVFLATLEKISKKASGYVDEREGEK